MEILSNPEKFTLILLSTRASSSNKNQPQTLDLQERPRKPVLSSDGDNKNLQRDKIVLEAIYV